MPVSILNLAPSTLAHLAEHVAGPRAVRAGARAPQYLVDHGLVRFDRAYRPRFTHLTAFGRMVLEELRVKQPATEICR